MYFGKIIRGFVDTEFVKTCHEYVIDVAILFIMTITNWTIIGQWTIMGMAGVEYWMITEEVDIGTLMEVEVDIGILMGGILRTMVGYHILNW